MPRSVQLAVAAALLVAVPACSSQEKTAAPASSTSTARPTSTAPASTTSPTAGGSTVDVRTFAFTPQAITVAAGTTVSWRNADDILHKPTAGRPGAPTGAFSVELAAKTGTGSATVATAGTIPYFCDFHESMTGEIVVTP